MTVNPVGPNSPPNSPPGSLPEPGAGAGASVTLGEGGQLSVLRRREEAAPPTASAAPAPTGLDPALFHRWRAMQAGGGALEKTPKGLDALWMRIASRAVHLHSGTRRAMRRARRICDQAGRWREMDASALRQAVAVSREQLRRGRADAPAIDDAIAQVRELSRRTLGMEPYPVQVAAGLVMWEGNLAELATGEGKTLVAAIPAVLHAWRSGLCHVFTVNDYLAGRDAQLNRPLYEACGLRVAALDGEMRGDDRRNAYAADITYGTHQEMAADFLRDRIAMQDTRGLTRGLIDELTTLAGGKGAGGKPGSLVMRGLGAAVVDEADSVLIDECVTPLIISEETQDKELEAAWRLGREFAMQLDEGRDYKVDRLYREIELLPRGTAKLRDWCRDRGGLWAVSRSREEMVEQALSAEHLFSLGRHYIVDHDEKEHKDKVVIVDESTGRLMPDRSWRGGMHQAVEVKEGVEVSPIKNTQARISFQRFFRQYPALCGMSGTVWEARHEMYEVYGMKTIRIPTNKPRIRIDTPDRVFAAAQPKWQAMAEHIRQVHATGRPILIGTRTIAESEHVSAMLQDMGLDHQVLNARYHAAEADIVSAAGQPGRITVATNMAGRGTDIKLGQGVRERGGLHVVVAERNEQRRVDRQLMGRAGRQGDPGDTATFASAEDDLIVRYGRTPRIRCLLACPAPAGRLPGAPARLALTLAQRRAARAGAAQRRGVLKADDQMTDSIGFAGAGD